MLSNQEREELKDLVIQGDLPQVFNRLRKVLSLKKENDLVILEREYRFIEGQGIQHLISNDEYIAGINRINNAVLKFIDSLVKEDPGLEKKSNSNTDSSKKNKKMFHTIGRRDDTKGLEKTELNLLTNFLEKVQRSRRKINELPPNSHYLPDLIGILVDLDKELKLKENRWGEDYADSALVSSIKALRTQANGFLMEISQERRSKNEFDASEYIRSNVAPYFQRPLEMLEHDIARTIKKLSVK